MAKACPKMGISEQTFYCWNANFQGMGIAELRSLRAEYLKASYGVSERWACLGG